MDDIDERHFIDVADSVAEGYVVPFLGAGANLCDRPDEVAWEPGRFLPNGSELAHALAEKGRYPSADDSDLLRVSQYIGAVRGEKDLYRYLRTIFDVDYPPNSLHRFLARIPAYLRERGAPQLLTITTNYDDLLERALDEQGEAYDLVWYEAKHGRLAGKFIHRAPGARAGRDRRGERVRRALAGRAAGHPQAPRGDRPEQSEAATASSSPRTTTSTISRAATSAPRSRSRFASA